MRNYSREFKEEALKLSDEIGVQRAASQLGVPYYSLADWRSNRRRRLKDPHKPLTEAEQAARLKELERESEELRKANEILKDALGFFAKDRKK